MTSRSRPVTREPGRVAGLPPVEVDPVPVHDILRLPEHGFGKPEERAYNQAIETLGVGPRETWMVGDNLEWEIMAPQRLGTYAI
jgi:phosphoglycolate phosphatase-like HAD superfamily hydrolase